MGAGLDGELTPCEADVERTGRDWTAEGAPLTRRDLVEMVEACEGCPIFDRCKGLAEAGALDSEGKRRGPVTGVWAGQVWIQGQPVDPRVEDDGRARRSIFRNVYFEQRRGLWKAEVQRDRRNIHLGYFEDESEAGRAAWEWLEVEEERDWRERQQQGKDAAA